MLNNHLDLLFWLTDLPFLVQNILSIISSTLGSRNE
jgi:hypothetical protein